MVSFDSLFEKYVGVAKPSSSKTLNLNLVAPTPTSFDRNEAMLKSQLPHQWHDNLVRLVASYVGEGKSDQDIHAITDELTCGGYTIPQTRSDVQIMINGARQKGFDKESQTLEFQKSDKPFLQKFSEIELKPIDYLIQDLIPKRGLVKYSANQGVGKAFWQLIWVVQLQLVKNTMGLIVQKGVSCIWLEKGIEALPSVVEVGLVTMTLMQRRHLYMCPVTALD